MGKEVRMNNVKGPIELLLEVGVRTVRFTKENLIMGRPFFSSIVEDGGPIELIGGMAIDPATGRREFSVEAVRFDADRMPVDIPSADIARAYFMAFCGNPDGTVAVEALKLRNFTAFYNALYREEESCQDSGPEVRHFCRT